MNGTFAKSQHVYTAVRSKGTVRASGTSAAALKLSCYGVLPWPQGHPQQLSQLDLQWLRHTWSHKIIQLISVQVPVAKASLSNPGIPPSSLMAWLKAKPAIQGAVLAGFDSQYTNPHALGPSDASDTLRPAQIAAAAEVVARTVFSAATGAPAGDLPVSDSVAWITAALFVWLLRGLIAV